MSDWTTHTLFLPLPQTSFNLNPNTLLFLPPFNATSWTFRPPLKASPLANLSPHPPPPRLRPPIPPQCIELDFQYPSEGIPRRWDAGFRITACAATPDQSAFSLSVPRRRPMDETQETLRTSAFPSSHVKEKWAKNLYIAGIAYGRTVS